MNDIRGKFSRRRVAIGILLVSLATFAVVYALVRTRTGLAVLTSLPPGIPGPYYVTAEAKIYGSVVDLATIKSKMGGEYASDYTYVQWGTRPFYRVYVDNTLQEVYYGTMFYIMRQFSSGEYIGESFSIEMDLKNTCETMKDVGSLDPSSVLGEPRYFGNLPGSFIAYNTYHKDLWTDYVNVSSSRWYAAEAWNGHAYLSVYLNETMCLYLEGSSHDINSSGSSANFYRWKIVSSYSSYMRSSATLYFEDLLDVQAQLQYLSPTAKSELRTYTVIDSPGTGFVSKCISPSSPLVGSTIGVTVRLDPPSAEKVNITDLYPNSFTWASVDVLLEKFKVDTGLEESVYVNVVPVPDGSDMKFTIYYNQAQSILQSLLSDEYIYLTYSLRVPDVAGEYTLPAATMSYLIPTP